MKQKGIILKIKKQSAIIMSDTCGFYEIKRLPGMSAGEEFEFTSEDMISHRRRMVGKYGAIAASFLAFLLIGMFMLQTYGMNNQTFAYVSVDINPSIQMAVGAKKTVLKVWGLNDEGQEIVDQVDLLKIPVEEAMEKIINTAVDKHYINRTKENFILVTAVPVKEKVSREEISELSYHLQDFSCKVLNQENQEAQVKVIVAETDNAKEIVKKKVSVGRYVLNEKINSNATLSGHSGEKEENTAKQESQHPIKQLYDAYRQNSYAEQTEKKVIKGQNNSNRVYKNTNSESVRIIKEIESKPVNGKNIDSGIPVQVSEENIQREANGTSIKKKNEKDDSSREQSQKVISNDVVQENHAGKTKNQKK